MNQYRNLSANEKEPFLINYIYEEIHKRYGDQSADNFSYSDFASPIKFICEEIQEPAVIHRVSAVLFTKGGVDYAKKFIHVFVFK